VLVVAVAGLAGALDEVPAEELPTVAVAELNEGEPWNVTVVNSVLAADLEPAVLQEDGYWLAVIAEVEITADESWTGGLHDALYVTDVEGMVRERVAGGLFPGAIIADDIRLVRDGSAAGALHPGLPERLAFLWELDRDTPPPAEVRVVITGKELVESTLTGYLEWLRDAPRAQLTLPIEDRREADGEA
jgi:hypothetical protein